MSAHELNDWKLVREAADWVARLEAGERDAHQPFLEWVRQSPLHVREFLAISRWSHRLADIDPHRRRDVQQLLAQDTGAVVELQNAAAPVAPARRTRRLAWSGAAAAALTALAVFVAWTSGRGPLVYSTGLGEQRMFKLPDGSLIHLNTQSRARIAYDDASRTITLLSGEALFTVARDPARPFRVAAGDTLIEAVGTQFNVYRRDTGTQVAVVEGRVRVSEAGAPATTLLSAGEGAKVDTRGVVSRLADAPVDRAVAWRQRLLAFRDTPLADAAAEFNRYNTLQLHVEGEAVRALQVTGFFNADNPEGLLKFLGRDGTLSIETGETGATIRARRD